MVWFFIFEQIIAFSQTGSTNTSAFTLSVKCVNVFIFNTLFIVFLKNET